MPTPPLSSSAARVLRVLLAPPTVAEDVTADMVAAIIEEPLPAAELLLNELTAAGKASQTRPGKYQLLVGDGEQIPKVDPDDHVTVRRLIEWYVHRAIQAERTILPHSWRLSPIYDQPGTSPFPSPATAMDWYEHHRVLLMESLSSALDHGFNELAWQLAEALWGLSRFAERREDQAESQRLGIEALNRMHQGRTSVFHSRRAFALTDLGELEAAEQAARAAVALARSAGDARALSTALSTRARTITRAGRPEDAISDLDRALELSENLGDPRAMALRYRRRGEAQAGLGEIDSALGSFAAAADLMASVGDQVGHARVLTKAGAVLNQQGRHVEAIEQLREALSVVTGSGSAKYAAEVYTELARGARGTGNNHAAATTFYNQAIDAYNAAGRADLADRVRAELADHTGTRGTGQ